MGKLKKIGAVHVLAISIPRLSKEAIIARMKPGALSRLISSSTRKLCHGVLLDTDGMQCDGYTGAGGA